MRKATKIKPLAFLALYALGCGAPPPPPPAPTPAPTPADAPKGDRRPTSSTVTRRPTEAKAADRYRAPAPVPPPAPHPPSASSRYAHEPTGAGWTTLVDDPFNGLKSPPWARTHFAGAIWLRDENDPASPGGAMERVFRAGTGTGGTTGGSVALGRSTWRQLYVGWTVKHSANWVSHPSGVNKMAFLGTSYDRNAVNSIVIGLIGTAKGYRVLIAVQTPTGNGGSSTLGYKNQNMADVPYALGAWHQIEVMIGQSTGGLANGTLDWWVDGTLVGHYQNINYDSTNPESFVEYLNWHPYLGGSDPVWKLTADQWIVDGDLLVKGSH